MKVIGVQFGEKKETFKKTYFYKTKLPLITGAVYEIEADNYTKYNNNVIVISTDDVSNIDNYYNMRTITKARCIKMPKRPDDKIKKVMFNKEKRITTVVWKDGMVTMVKCDKDDKWDKEKALALCYMKREFDNRGCFNEALRKWTT